MKRTYEVHFTVKGIKTISFDDCDYDTADYESIAEDIFCNLCDETLRADIDLDTLKIADVKRTFDD